MHLLAGTLAPFFGLTDTFALPEEGIVLVRGPNGCGKSTRFIEATRWARHGETVRGVPVWPADDKDRLAEVRMRVRHQAQDYEIRRRLKGQSKTIEFGLVGASPDDRKFLTPTKAQEAINRTLGNPNTWFRTHVFSALTLGQFTAGKDKDRKAILEELLELFVIDEQYAKVDKELTALSSELARLTATTAQQRAQLDAERQRLKEGAGLDPAAADLREDAQAMHEHSGRAFTLDGEAADTERELARAEAALNQARRAQAVMNEQGVCVTCARPLPEALRAKLTADTAAAYEASRKRHAELGPKILSLRNEAQRLRRLAQEIGQRVSASEARARLHALVERSQKAVTALEETVANNEFDILSMEDEAKVLRGMKELFGRKGLKTALMAEKLFELGDLANAYLQDFSAMSVSLVIDADDELDIQVSGRGGGYGYKGLSVGERRCLDLAILSSLSALSPEPGTLFFDDVFDGLDADNRGAVVTLLERVSVDRAALVLTQNLELGKNVRATSLDYTLSRS